MPKLRARFCSFLRAFQIIVPGSAAVLAAACGRASGFERARAGTSTAVIGIADTTRGCTRKAGRASNCIIALCTSVEEVNVALVVPARAEREYLTTSGRRHKVAMKMRRTFNFRWLSQALPVNRSLGIISPQTGVHGIDRA